MKTKLWIYKSTITKLFYRCNNDDTDNPNLASAFLTSQTQQIPELEYNKKNLENEIKIYNRKQRKQKIEKLNR